MNKPSVSIIVPVYNVEPYVEACIRSVMSQRYSGPIECIVVDDCGTDNSMAIVERMIDEYNGPIVFSFIHHTHNRGISAARNTGMDAASSDYLFFLDSDDELTDDCLQKLSEPLLEKSYDIIVGMFKINSENVGNNNVKLILPAQSQLTGHEIIQTYCEGYLNSMVWNKLYPTSFLRSHQLRFQENIYFEDELWTLQLACLSRSLYVVRQTTYIYRKRKNSITTLYNFDNTIKANAYYTYVIEMGKFVQERNIYESVVYDNIRRRFYITLRLLIFHPFVFIKKYRLMRQYTMKPLFKFFSNDVTSVKRIVHDIHFIIPSHIASYIEYGVEVMYAFMRYTTSIFK